MVSCASIRSGEPGSSKREACDDDSHKELVEASGQTHCQPYDTENRQGRAEHDDYHVEYGLVFLLFERGDGLIHGNARHARALLPHDRELVAIHAEDNGFADKAAC
mgnify:CR=1 FL=1